ncbi:hypothetical protein EDB84DRAFT_1437696 [Lactarius hengduanensis]|nr:hypothetical protein EDB84DRAFT_1437696 [Lactarius hengduanensis]
MSSTQADASSFIQYSEAVFTTGTVEGASNMILSQGASSLWDLRPELGRPQDLRRHIIDKHMPRRQCPFCSHEWSRPDRIKAHLTEAHRDVLSAEVLQGICALRGQAVVNFLETYEPLHDPSLQFPARSSLTSENNGRGYCHGAFLISDTMILSAFEVEVRGDVSSNEKLATLWEGVKGVRCEDFARVEFLSRHLFFYLPGIPNHQWGVV